MATKLTPDQVKAAAAKAAAAKKVADAKAAAAKVAAANAAKVAAVAAAAAKAKAASHTVSTPSNWDSSMGAGQKSTTTVAKPVSPIVMPTTTFPPAGTILGTRSDVGSEGTYVNRVADGKGGFTWSAPISGRGPETPSTMPSPTVTPMVAPTVIPPFVPAITPEAAAVAADADFKDLQAQYDALLTQRNADAASASAIANAETNSKLGELQTKFDDLLNKQAQDKATLELNAAAEKKQKRDSIVDVLTARFKSYGLDSLVGAVMDLARDDASEDTITLKLQETDTYKERFKANDVRMKANLAVLTPKEYLTLEDSYRQVLRASGLTQFDNDAYVSQFIGNDMSANELASRVDIGMTKIKNAPPETLKALSSYYGINSGDLFNYLLDPKQQMPAIQSKINAAEIGGAASRQGFDINQGAAEGLASQGVTLEQARSGYSTIGDLLPTSQKLSDIYGKTQDGYDLASAQQEVFSGLASARRKREGLIKTEQANWMSSSGTNSSAFGKSAAGQI